MNDSGCRRSYAIRRPMSKVKTLEVTFPYEVADREARKKGISLDEFLDQYKVNMEYGDSLTVTYTIIEKAAA